MVRIRYLVVTREGLSYVPNRGELLAEDDQFGKARVLRDYNRVVQSHFEYEPVPEAEAAVYRAIA